MVTREKFQGGSAFYTPSNGDTLNLRLGRTHTLDSVAEGISVKLPNFSGFPKGGPIAFLVNKSSNVISVLDQSSNLLYVIPACSVTTLCRGVSSWNFFADGRFAPHKPGTVLDPGVTRNEGTVCGMKVLWFGVEDDLLGDDPDSNIAVFGQIAHHFSGHINFTDTLGGGQYGDAMPYIDPIAGGWSAVSIKATATGNVGVFFGYGQGYFHKLRAYVNGVYQAWNGGDESIDDQIGTSTYPVYPPGITPWINANPMGTQSAQTGVVRYVAMNANDILTFHFMEYHADDSHIVPAPTGTWTSVQSIAVFDIQDLGSAAQMLWYYDIFSTSPSY